MLICTKRDEFQLQLHSSHAFLVCCIPFPVSGCSLEKISFFISQSHFRYVSPCMAGFQQWGLWQGPVCWGPTCQSQLGPTISETSLGPPHTRATARQAEDPTVSQLRHISGRLAAIVSRRYTENTFRKANEGRDDCGDMELGTHSWKEEPHVNGRQPMAYRQPRVGRDNPVGLWQWVINTR